MGNYSDISSLPVILYYFSLACLVIYGFHRVWLLFCWRRIAFEPVILTVPVPEKDVPFVTVQLPVYNERFVAERLINAACELDWPGEKLEIQVLDDSDDDSCSIIDTSVSLFQKKGININVIRRKNRKGFKAGALHGGTAVAEGEFIAVFDADFVPPPDFLKRTVPCFNEPDVGMVQARWGFLNSGYSWFTRIQSLLLGPHFSIEHNVRFRRGLFFNFNGTAGIWRRKAIETSGGWQSDTVTEDLDLSYRAQLKGWRFVYLNDLVVPSELPVTMNAFRSQQQRWAKGSIQTARKILPKIIFSKTLTIGQKTESVFHLLANMGWLLGCISVLTLYPVMVSRSGIGPYDLIRIDLPLITCASGFILFYFLYYTWIEESVNSLVHVFIIPVLTIGLAPGLSLSILQGFFQRGGVFERTPKFGGTGQGKLPGTAFIYKQKKLLYPLMNLLLLVYSVQPVIFSCNNATWVALPFVLVFFSGFLMVTLMDIMEFFDINENSDKR